MKIKPMIFYVDIECVYPGIFVASSEQPKTRTGQNSTIVKVIEYSAYEELLKKIEGMENEVPAV